MASLEAACAEAIALLEELGKSGPRSGLFARARGVLFSFSTKAGVGVGLESGQGFYLSKLPGGGWTAPLFIKSSALRAGVIVGVGKTSTLLLSMSPALADRLQGEGSRIELGADVSVALGTLLRSEEEGGFELPMDDVDTVAFQVASGAIIDASLKGGKLSVDAARNQEAFGPDATPARLLSGAVPAPPQFQPLYSRLADLAAAE